MRFHNPFPHYKPPTLEDKKRMALATYGDLIVLELPPDPAFLHDEGVRMRHCLETDYAAYAMRIRTGAQRHFSFVDTRDGQPKVNLELAVTRSSYQGLVESPVITQVRGVANQCPPDDRYIPAVVAFCTENGLALQHKVPTKNFDDRLDGQLVLDRWAKINHSS
jgi:hypothetical protein